MTTIRVVVADQHLVFAQAIAAMISSEPDMAMIGVCESGKALLEFLQGRETDVVVVDPADMGTHDMTLVHDINVSHQGIKIVVLSSNHQEQHLLSAVRAGAHAYLSKSVDIADLLEAIRAVAGGAVRLSPEHALNLLDEYARLSFVETGLTARERDVLDGITRGDSNREIARCLNLSEKTVKNYSSGIFGKLQVHDRTEAAMYALSTGLAMQGDWRMSVKNRRGVRMEPAVSSR